MRRASQAQQARCSGGPTPPTDDSRSATDSSSRDGELVLGHDRLLYRPVLPLRAAALAATHGPDRSATLTNLAKGSPFLCPGPAGTCRAAPGNLLASGPGLVPVWEGLDQAGIIGSWFPSGVPSARGRSAARASTRWIVTSSRRWCTAGGMVQRVSRPDLLLNRGTLHDIGRRGARDHSLEAPRSPMPSSEDGPHPETDVALVERLVQEHPDLVELATPTRPCRPQGPSRWKAISASGGTLAGFTCWALTEGRRSGRRTGGLDGLESPPRGSTHHRRACQLDPTRPNRTTLLPGATGRCRTCRARWAGASRPGRRGRRGGSTSSLDRPLGPVRRHGGRAGRRGLIVQTAIVRTLDGLAVNEWHVGSPRVENPDPAPIGRLIGRLATGDLSPLVALEKQRNRPTRPSATADTASPGRARAMIVPGASPDATDARSTRPGSARAAHDLGRTFTRAGISVRSAHVATYAGQTLDTFCLTDVADRPLAPAQVARVVGLVIDTCGPEGRWRNRPAGRDQWPQWPARELTGGVAGVQLRPRHADKVQRRGEPATAADSATTRAASSLAAQVTPTTVEVCRRLLPSRSWGRGLG